MSLDLKSRLTLPLPPQQGTTGVDVKNEEAVSSSFGPRLPAEVRSALTVLHE